MKPGAATARIPHDRPAAAPRPPAGIAEDPNVRGQLVAIVLDGLKARLGDADPPLPGYPPTMERYAELCRTPGE